MRSRGATGNLFGRSTTPDGDITTVKHENGTVHNYINNAVMGLGRFDGITDG